MARDLTRNEIFSQYAHTTTGQPVNPMDLYLMNSCLGRSGIYHPSPRPQIMIVNTLDYDLPSIVEYHVSNFPLYEEDIAIDTIPFGINFMMLKASLCREPDPNCLPVEVLERTGCYDMWVTKFPIIDDKTMEDWLTLFLFGAYSLKEGGVGITYLQDVDQPGFEKLMRRIKGMSRSEPAIYEETPFTMADGLGSLYHRVCVYKRPDWAPPQPIREVLCSN